MELLTIENLDKYKPESIRILLDELEKNATLNAMVFGPDIEKKIVKKKNVLLL